MGLLNNFALGRNLACVMKNEATFNTTPTNVNGVGAVDYWSLTADQARSAKLLSVKVDPSWERKLRTDTRASRSIFEEIEGVISTSWEAEAYMLPRGGTTPPDITALLTSACGIGAVAGPDFAYTLSASQALPPPFAMHLSTSSLPTYAEYLLGAVCDEVTFSGASGEEPKIRFSGMAARHGITGNSTLNGALVGAELFFVVATGGTRAFTIGDLIQVGTSTGHYITNLNHATHTVTVAPAIVGAQGNGSAVTPMTRYLETDTAGLVTPGIYGGLDIGADLGISVTAFELSIKNNWKAIIPMFNQTMTDAVPGNREITGSATFYAQSPDIIRIGRSRFVNTASVNPLSLNVQFGLGTSNRVVINCPSVSFKPTGVEMPEAEEATFTLEFVALATGTGENEVTITWD